MKISEVSLLYDGTDEKGKEIGSLQLRIRGGLEDLQIFLEESLKEVNISEGLEMRAEDSINSLLFSNCPHDVLYNQEEK